MLHGNILLYFLIAKEYNQNIPTALVCGRVLFFQPCAFADAWGFLIPWFCVTFLFALALGGYFYTLSSLNRHSWFCSLDFRYRIDSVQFFHSI